MQRQLIVKSIGLGTSSDLTLIAPLRTGFVPSLDSVTYKTRVKSVLAVLHGARKSSHEYASAQLLSDAVERVGVIQSVRVVVLEPEDSVLLAVTFDGPWQSYIRVLWDKVGALLDLIFCNTQGYKPAWNSSLEEWVAWAKAVQRETGFFYGPPDTSATDTVYDRRLLRMREGYFGDDPTIDRLRIDELRAVAPTAEAWADRLAKIYDNTQKVRDDPPIMPPPSARVAAEQVRQYLQALVGLYRLTDLYVPPEADPHGDGDFLHRAAIELLREFIPLFLGTLKPDIDQQRERFDRALNWLCPPGTSPRALSRTLPPLPPAFELDSQTRHDVQGGILHAADGLTHGALLLFNVGSPRAAAAFLKAIVPQITRDSEPQPGPPGTIYRSMSFTPDGLRACGLDEDTMGLFPEEFLQGMAARAGALGDVRHNHPRRWRLPPRFVPNGSSAAVDTVDLAAVHVLLQLRCTAAESATYDVRQPNHPLAAEVARCAALHQEATLLAVQSMRRRYTVRNGADVVVDHFGYADGSGQPDLEWQAGPARRANRVQLGEVLWGHANRADPPPAETDPRLPWMHNGSFLVLRKYRMFPERLHDRVQDTADQMANRLGGRASDHEETVYAKMVGRRRDGTPLAPAAPTDLNDFNYASDPQGAGCPLHSHIRRANPRQIPVGSARPPRLVRRGMSYGPELGSASDEERGLVFMAYNQSLGEQFEVVQRWLAGGNSTGSSSAVACPLLGVPENGLPRQYPFETQDVAFDVSLEQPTALFEDPLVVTELQWGLYAFTPSISTLESLAARALAAADALPRFSVPWEADGEIEQARGRIASLLAIKDEAVALDAWKQALEDPDAINRQRSAALWAAIRRHHGGALKTPYATLIADRKLILRILQRDDRYSVCGQRQRMLGSFGDIYLGLDAGLPYDQQSAKMNAAIGKLAFSDVFEHARASATKKLAAVVTLARVSSKTNETRWETIVDAREVMDDVLADLTEQWFGVQLDSRDLLVRGSANWAWAPGQASIYPGHFTALSRNMFQPHPGSVPKNLAANYGKALQQNMRCFVERHQATGQVPTAPDGAPAELAQAAFEMLTEGYDADFVGRLITGVIMGYTPTIIGAALNVLLEWRRDDRFGALRNRLAGRTDLATAKAVLDEAVHEAARIRPMPQITWRTVTQAHHLVKSDGKRIRIDAKAIVALGLASGTQQSLSDGCPDGRLMFGGVRRRGGPTHACPGHEAGAAAMLGCLVALLTCGEELREGPQPLTYALQGELHGPHVATAQHAAHELSLRTLPPQPLQALIAASPQSEQNLTELARIAPTPIDETTPLAPHVHSGKTIMFWGDSWLAFGLFPLKTVTDLVECLGELGYEIGKNSKDFCDFRNTAAAMAADPSPFCSALDSAITATSQPVAILVSAGGDDSTRAALLDLILKKGSATILDPNKVTGHVDALKTHFETMLTAIQAVFVYAGVGNSIPVLVHGYDNPIPNGKGVLPVAFPFEKEWLFDVFQQKGYQVGKDGTDTPVAAAAMAELIGKFNTMLGNLHTQFPFVRHVCLLGTIADHNANPSDGWLDDLHPSKAMFQVMAGKIAAAI